MNDTPTGIEELVAELESIAARLREGQLEQGEAASLVERCAELANRIGGQLEREARATTSGDQPGQEQLL
jgi:predicted transcriptional regulator